MDNSNNWRPTQAGEPPMENADWRTQLQPDSRQRIVNKIIETLNRHLPFSGQEGLQERKKIAVRFEEKIYSAAINQSDYLRKISLKLLTMENKSNPMPNAMQSSSAVNNTNSPDPAKRVDHMRGVHVANGRRAIKILETIDFDGDAQANKTLLKEAIEIIESIFSIDTATVEDENARSCEQSDLQNSESDVGEDEHEEAVERMEEHEVSEQPTRPIEQYRRIRYKKKRCA